MFGSPLLRGTVFSRYFSVYWHLPVCQSVCVCACVINNQALPFVNCCQGQRGGRGRTGCCTSAPQPIPPPCMSSYSVSFCPLALLFIYTVNNCLLLLAVSVCLSLCVFSRHVVGVFQVSLVETWVAGIPQAGGASRPMLLYSHVVMCMRHQRCSWLGSQMGTSSASSSNLGGLWWSTVANSFSY